MAAHDVALQPSRRGEHQQQPIRVKHHKASEPRYPDSLDLNRLRERFMHRRDPEIELLGQRGDRRPPPLIFPRTDQEMPPDGLCDRQHDHTLQISTDQWIICTMRAQSALHAPA
ncbi:MAG: hypothetical protein ACLP50_27905 [Solirubrobacteraceae bacterium]